MLTCSANLYVLCTAQSGCVFYSQAQLSVVSRLEALLLRAVREGDDQVTQSVCAALWNSCLPLLQHNLRKNLKSPLLTLSQALENINRFVHVCISYLHLQESCRLIFFL